VNLLRDRRLAALLVAEVISSTGTQMTWLALPWFVLRTTGSAERMTWVIVAEVVPIAVLGFYGGAVAARLGTRRTMLTCDLLRVPLFAAIPALNAFGLLPFPVLIVLVALSGVFLAPYFSVQRAVVPELIGEEHADVAQATALFQLANRTTIALGPPLAGVLIATIGKTQVLYVDAATYLVSFLLVAFFVHPPEAPVDTERPRVLDGIRFLLGDKLLRVWLAAFTLIDVCWQLIFASLLVLAVTAYGGSVHVAGVLSGAFGAGSIVGALVSMRLVRRFEPLLLTGVAFVFELGALWLLAIPAGWEVPALAMATAGVFTSIVNAPMQSLMVLRMPRDIRTQAIAAFGVVQSIGSPVGLVLGGAALAHYDTHSVLAVVLAVDTLAIGAAVVMSFVERAGLRAVDSPA
jgi:MFS family permease